MALLEPFRIFKHLREERERNRQHQLELVTAVSSVVESFFDGQLRAADTNASSIRELAAASAKNTEAFSQWLKLFQSAAAPATSVVREEDELAEEQKRQMDALGLDPQDLPEEFQLALKLRRDEFSASIRDTKDD